MRYYYYRTMAILVFCGFSPDWTPPSKRWEDLSQEERGAQWDLFFVPMISPGQGSFLGGIDGRSRPEMLTTRCRRKGGSCWKSMMKNSWTQVAQTAVRPFWELNRRWWWETKKQTTGDSVVQILSQLLPHPNSGVSSSGVVILSNPADTNKYKDKDQYTTVYTPIARTFV